MLGLLALSSLLHVLVDLAAPVEGSQQLCLQLLELRFCNQINIEIAADLTFCVKFTRPEGGVSEDEFELSQRVQPLRRLIFETAWNLLEREACQRREDGQRLPGSLLRIKEASSFSLSPAETIH